MFLVKIWLRVIRDGVPRLVISVPLCTCELVRTAVLVLFSSFSRRFFFVWPALYPPARLQGNEL